MMDVPRTPPFKPYANGRKFIDDGPSLVAAIDYAANAILQLREEGGEDTDGKGSREPVNESTYAKGLIRLFMGERAPQDDGRNCSRGDISVNVERVMAQAYRLGKLEARYQH